MLTLVRHGRTEANASGLLLGRLDPPLDAEGRVQAELVAASLVARGDAIARVVTSPLARTRATAQVIAASVNAEVEVDERWIELDYGELDGVPLADVPRRTWQDWQADTSWCPPGGESLVALGERVWAALADLEAEAAHDDIVVVSHVSPIKSAVAWALGVDDSIAWRMFLAPASITRIAVGGRAPSLHVFNDVSHLHR